MEKLRNSPLIGIIANSTTLQNREDLVRELGEPHNGFFNSLKFNFQDMRGEIVPLDIQSVDISKKSDFAAAKLIMFEAVKYLVERGPKIICFAAATKRLMGKLGEDIKDLYPDIIFTIGDNTTMISFTALLNHFLPSLDKERDLVACLGAGFLGEQAIKTYLHHGFKNIILLSEQKITWLPPEVSVINSLAKLPSNLKFLTGCAHKYKIDPDHFKNLFAESAIIVDVSVPQAVNFNVYQALPKKVRRFDGGDFYLTDVNYDFKPEVLKFPEAHFWYGCFTEAIMLNLAYRDGHELSNYNFFEINDQNKNLINGYLKKEQVSVPLINFFNPINQGVITF